jgi:hypothetical protein
VFAAKNQRRCESKATCNDNGEPAGWGRDGHVLESGSGVLKEGMGHWQALATVTGTALACLIWFNMCPRLFCGFQVVLLHGLVGPLLRGRMKSPQIVCSRPLASITRLM